MPPIDVPKIAKGLQELASTSAGRSETAQLAALIKDIEAALASGVPRVEVLNHLNENGFSMTMKSFDNALYRVRKRNARSSTAPLNESQSKALSTLTQPREVKSVPSLGSLNPAHSGDQEREAFSRDSIKTLDELAKEFPNLSKMQLIKMEAQQYDARPPTAADLDALALRYGPKSSA